MPLRAASRFRRVNARLPRTSSDEKTLRSWFPLTYGSQLLSLVPAAGGVATGGAIGVVLRGRQAPGGHNIIAGLVGYCEKSPRCTLCRCVYSECVKPTPVANAPASLFSRLHWRHSGPLRSTHSPHHAPIARELQESGRLPPPRAQRRQDPTPRGRLQRWRRAPRLRLRGLVLIGGTFTNTDAAHLAEYFAANQQCERACSRTAVIGVPASIDGDIHNQFVEATLGFDTATRV